MFRETYIKLAFTALFCLFLTGCIGTVVGAVVDTTVEVVKIPFKVGGAIIDVVTPDEFADSLDSQHSDEEKIKAQEAALKMEQDSL